jgi:sugar (pentulose or hexulose) kinase
VRALAEAQIMSMYLHSGWTGTRPKEIMVTAGGSANQGLLKLIAQVFGVRVRAREVSDSAALGAAFRAAALVEPGLSLAELAGRFLKGQKESVVQAGPAETNIYQGEHGLLRVYQACQDHHLGKGPSPVGHIEAFRQNYGPE